MKNTMEVKHTTNRLLLYRKRMELSQKQVAAILGLKNIAILSHYERGTSRPSLQRALGLEIVYRVPVAFLFPELYEEIREEVRAKESRMARPLNAPFS
jgi:transcriptional regulator with XRE-family HTH domain